MPGRQAKAITPVTMRRMMRRVQRGPQPERDAAIILLSLKSGLRACEIARLEWSMVLDARGRIAGHLTVEDRIAKKQTGRRIPIHPKLAEALQALLKISTGRGPVIRSRRGGALLPNSIVNWFVVLFAELEVEGCSSHSGRRTFITSAARALPKIGGSLRDVQLLAGHRSIETTQAYIDGDTDAQRRLIAVL